MTFEGGIQQLTPKGSELLASVSDQLRSKDRKQILKSFKWKKYEKLAHETYKRDPQFLAKLFYKYTAENGPFASIEKLGKINVNKMINNIIHCNIALFFHNVWCVLSS